MAVSCAGMKAPTERQMILVANAHMHWDPEFSDVKLIQTMMFLSELKSIAQRAATALTADPATIPVVLCADLNSLPDSGRGAPPSGHSMNHSTVQALKDTIDGGILLDACVMQEVERVGW